ncbi:helix-turn-helix transcriptional regulator [uncultured Hyphomicrobium sp.]|uniref:helix-turn-helix transcriptional regulator n=1 Tax=uncultured Hyphomicrobium sp. TaxID=194373 RepID=UPI0025DA7FB2|nr:helix-turn-helix transcriptional regulator [uncultured Hyphomicrobium sp.]
MIEGREEKQPDLLGLVGQIYDCAIDPALWPQTLERVAGLMDAKNVALTLNSISNPGFEMRARWNIDADFEESMRANYTTNPLLPSVWYYGVDEAFSVLQVLDEEELKRTPWWEKTMGKHGYRDSAVSLLAKSVSQFGSISVQRTVDREPFDEPALSIMSRLAPHIRRAVHIGDLLKSRALERDMLSDTLQMLTVGIVLTDKAGRIVHTNLAGKSLIETSAAFHRDAGMLAARNPRSAADLENAIASAASGTTVDIPRVGIGVPLQSDDGKDIAAWVLPLDGGLRRDLGAAYTAQVAVFLRELGNTSPVPGELFVRRYGISHAECRVLLLIVQGKTAREVATELGISVATVKTHVARLLDKTHTERTVDLIQLAMSALAPAST